MDREEIKANQEDKTFPFYILHYEKATNLYLISYNGQKYAFIHAFILAGLSSSDGLRPRPQHESKGTVNQ